jgi:transcriptional regulator with XRE-family HTH domain
VTSQPDSGMVPHFTQGDRLRKARSLTGLNTREFAALLGVSHGTITNAERDARAVRPITLNAWAFATGVSRSWLETGVGTLQDGGADLTTPEERLRRLGATKKPRNAGAPTSPRYAEEKIAA